MAAISILKNFCTAYVQLTSPKVEAWLSQCLKPQAQAKTTDAVLNYWLQNYRALPWYRRWWQRLTTPVASLENFYEAQRILNLAETLPPVSLLASLRQIRAGLSWFSSLRSEIRKAENLLLQQIYAEGYHSFKEKTKRANSHPLINDLPQGSTMVASDLPLRLNQEGLRACQYLGLDITQPITKSKIHQAYKSLALQHHPDKNLGRETKAQEKFQEILKVYKFLEGFDNTASVARVDKADLDLASQIRILKACMQQSEKLWEDNFRQVSEMLKEQFAEADREQKQTLQTAMEAEKRMTQQMELQLTKSNLNWGKFLNHMDKQMLDQQQRFEAQRKDFEEKLDTMQRQINAITDHLATMVLLNANNLYSPAGEISPRAPRSSPGFY